MSRGVPYCPGPVSRRTLLQGGAFAFAGLGMAEMLRLQAESSRPFSEPAEAWNTEETAVIFIWLPGGPPHMEMYDMKPLAPAEYRGDFRPIPTNVPGIDVCEHLPLHSKIADKFTIVRSVAHNFADHGGGHKRFLTGRDPLEPAGFVNDYPAVPSMVAKVRENLSVGIPNYVSGTDGGRDGVDVFSFGSAYLGSSTHPFTVVGNPNDPGFQVRNLALEQRLAPRLDDRKLLLAELDNLSREGDRLGTMDSIDQFNRRALDLLTSDKAKRAFDLTLEPDAVRNRYGRHVYGQRALMARRLVEAGCSWVTMVLENCAAKDNPQPADAVYNWDSHAVNCHLFNDALWRFPHYDQAITALVEDLYSRGLDKRVMLVVTGEFGRTPRISYHNGRPGRDHWPSAMSMLLAGGGMRTGQIVGSTNAKGENPHDRPLTPNDLWATVLRHLKIDRNLSFLDLRGRPMPILPYGDPITELL